jgi:hypothetical protein
MNDELSATYDRLLQVVAQHDGSRAASMLDSLSRVELDAVFERAYQEQVVREDIREMTIRRMVGLIDP